MSSCVHQLLYAKIYFLHCFISDSYFSSDDIHTRVLAANVGGIKRNVEIKYGILRVNADTGPLLYLQIKRVLKTMRRTAFMLSVLACQ
jgi:sensor domain CHASE-containing protein